MVEPETILKEKERSAGKTKKRTLKVLIRGLKNMKHQLIALVEGIIMERLAIHKALNFSRPVQMGRVLTRTTGSNKIRSSPSGLMISLKVMGRSTIKCHILLLRLMVPGEKKTLTSSHKVEAIVSLLESKILMFMPKLQLIKSSNIVDIEMLTLSKNMVDKPSSRADLLFRLSDLYKETEVEVLVSQQIRIETSFSLLNTIKMIRDKDVIKPPTTNLLKSSLTRLEALARTIFKSMKMMRKRMATLSMTIKSLICVPVLFTASWLIKLSNLKPTDNTIEHKHLLPKMNLLMSSKSKAMKAVAI